MKRSRIVVIDADVARAAGGETSASNVAQCCRACLLVILDVCHRVAVTDAIAEEWKEHRSSFFRTWQTQMYARRKVVVVDSSKNRLLRKKISKTIKDGNVLSLLLKDVHLVEAALRSGKIVISLDEAARRALKSVAHAISDIHDVIWINPANRTDGSETWLREGANPERHKMLGSRPREVRLTS